MASLRSRQYARIVDLLSEGPIKGVVNGMQGVYFDGVKLQNSSGKMAFKNTKVQFVNGYLSQPIMSGFSSQEGEVTVGPEIKHDNPLTRFIVNTDADRCRVTVSVPSLYDQNDKGEMQAQKVEYKIEVQPTGKPWQLVKEYEINGKTTSKYQRAHEFPLPGIGPWTIRVTKTSIDYEKTDIQADLYWDSYTVIITDKVNYNRSACVGVTIDAEQFSSMPTRVYLTDGMRVLIPSNYDPVKATYSGTWDGKFKSSLEWTNNPAWCLYDMIVNNRYGLGSFISPALLDKWSFYTVGVWCDRRVNNGKGGTERRFTCNVQIMDQQEAFDLLAQMSAVFRGFIYWAGGLLTTVADMPSDPVAQFTNANVIDGSFSYSGADIRARHTMAKTQWKDGTLLGETRLSVAENRSQISRWGIQSADDDGFAITSEGQALRTSKWALYTEEYESEVVTFNTGLEAAWVRIGQVIRISDVNVAGSRMGGRVVSQYASDPLVIIVDKRPPMADGKQYTLSCILPSGAIVSKPAYLSSIPNGIAITTAFSSPPVPHSVFVLNDPIGLEPTLWQVMSVKQTDYYKFEISGKRYFPEKWDYVEKDMAFDLPDISNITAKPKAPINLAVREYMQQTSAISVGVRAVFSWQSSAPQFDVYWRTVPGNWQRQRTDAMAIDLPVVEGKHEFRVVPISRLGVPGESASITLDIVGRYALPPAPQGFRIHIADSVAMFSWLPVTELDVVVGGYFQLRHTQTLEGATWNSAQTVIPKIPGTATSCEATYLPGTWMLRTYDITGRASATWALIIEVSSDQRFIEWARICESPDYPGNHSNTELRLPQEWLTIKQVNSGYVDDQTDAVDDWLFNVDDMPVPSGQDPGPNVGIYTFGRNFNDLGAAFPIRFSSDILAFPFADPGTDFFDDRLTYSDTWANWDGDSANLDGQVILQIRSTQDDPDLATANWTNWGNFFAGEYFGRGFQFRAMLTAPPGENIGVETLCVLGDFKHKSDSGEDVLYDAVLTRVYFNINFYNVPAVVVTVQLAMAEDRIEILNKTREYFDLKITMTVAGGNPIGSRSFDWHAQGY